METRGFVLDPRGDLLLMLENPGSLFNGSQKVDRDQHGDAQSTPTAAVTHELAKLTTEPRFLYLVSSERLQRTSRYFRAALSGRWSVDVGPDGLKRMAASDWDPEALWNVLLVLHGRTVDLPMDMSLEMLAQVALIADYYGCEGAVSPIAVMWLGSKGDFLDDGADYEIAVLIFVSLVFGMQYEFSRATSIVMERRFEPISTNGLPIPEELIERMASEREAAMRRMYNALKTTYERLRRGDLGCTASCRDNLIDCLLTAVDVDKYLAPSEDEIVRRCTLQQLQHCERSVMDVAVSWSAPTGQGSLVKHEKGVIGWECLPITLMVGYAGLGPPRLRCEEFRGK